MHFFSLIVYYSLYWHFLSLWIKTQMNMLRFSPEPCHFLAATLLVDGKHLAEIPGCSIQSQASLCALLRHVGQHQSLLAAGLNSGQGHYQPLCWNMLEPSLSFILLF